jgi:outer membrane protein assembly factor BamB
VDKSGVYVGSDSSWIYAYDLQGYERWRRYIPRTKFGIHGTPSLDTHRVFIGAYNGVFYALNKNDGALIWSRKLGAAIGASPIIYENDVFIAVEKAYPPNGFIARLRGHDGAIVWQTNEIGEQAHSSPVISKATSMVYLGANNGNFFAHNLQTGELVWEFEDGSPIKGTAALIESGVTENGLVCFSSWSKNVHCLDALTGEKIWSAGIEFKSRSSPTFIPSLSYLVVGSDGGTIVALDVKTGNEKWVIKGGRGNSQISSALVVQRSLGNWILWDSCKKFHLCAIDGATGKILSLFDIDGDLTSVPVLHNNALYLSLEREGGLLRLDPSSSSTSDFTVSENALKGILVESPSLRGSKVDGNIDTKNNVKDISNDG